MLVFQFLRSFHVNGIVAAIQVDDDRDCYCSFGSGNRNDKNGKENTIQFMRPQVFIKSDEIEVYTIQDQLDAHQHRNKVTTGKESVDANKEKCSTYKEHMI